MKRKMVTFILFIAVALAIIAVIETFYALKVQELAREQAILSQQAQETESLKKRWSVQNSQGDFDFLKNHFNLAKEEKRGKNTYFEYKNLSMREFDNLSNRILNSMLIIKKLTLQRDNMSKGTITVEVES